MPEAIPYRNPLACVFQFADETPNALAARMNGHDENFKAFQSSILKRARYFKERGVLAGDRIAIYSDDDYETLLSLFSVWALGAIAIPMNISQPKEKLESIERAVPPKMGFYAQDFSLFTKPDFKTHPLAMSRRPLESVTPLAEEMAAIIMFTSGTSGVPKAVPMTAFAIGHNAYETGNRLKITKEDRIFINTPMYYTSAIIHALTLMMKGGGIVAERGFLFGSGLIERIRENACTGFGGVPVHLARILAGIEEAGVPSSLRFLMNSGEHLPVSLLSSLLETLQGIEIYSVYGLTEVAGRLCILSPEDLPEKIGSVGKPLEGMKIHIRDEKGKIARPNEEGEVVVSGVCLMEGYLNAPEKTREAMSKAGFLTGDIGRMDEAGNLYLIGRKDDIVKVGGEKVSVKMIENAVIGFQPFEDFMVAPIYDERMGNIPCLFYVLKEGEAFKKKALLKHLKPKLPASHLPPKFQEVKKIPRTGSGKPIRDPNRIEN